jgi:hypothetical protein
MDTSTFDPTRAVVFDLNRGRVTLDQGDSVLVIPAEALAQVCSKLEPSAVRQFGVALGKHAGARVRGRVGAQAAPSLETMVNQLGGELSLSGLGSLSIELWGQALVVRVDGCPLGLPGQDLMSAYIESALLAIVGREVIALVLERAAQSSRLLLCSPAASARVKGWLSAGGSWGDALVALHQSPKNDVAGGKL